MATRYADRYAADTFPNGELTLALWNDIMLDIDLRVSQTEELIPDVQNLIDSTQELVLSRLQETINPAIEQIQEAASLGFLTAGSTTSANLTNNNIIVFVLSEGAQRELFQPSAFVNITRLSSVNEYAVARVMGFVRERGELQVQIIQQWGSVGPFNDWQISASAGVVAAIVQMLASVQSLANLAGSHSTTAGARATNAANSAGSAASSAGDAAGSASAASTSASAAASSATASSLSAARLQGTSTSTYAPSLGSKNFATQSSKAFAAGTWLMLQSRTSANRWMFGKSSSYAGNTLTVDVVAIGSDVSSSAGADWDISVAGARGLQGIQGDKGDTGTIPPADRFVFKGDYSTANAYAIGDVVIAGTGLYRCIEAVAAGGNTNPPAQPTKWVTVTPPAVEVANIARLQRAARLIQFRTAI